MIDLADLERPIPDDDVSEGAFTANDRIFRAAPEVQEWLFESFINDDAPLCNHDHWHLRLAHIGVLWTNIEAKRNQIGIAGMAEKPMPQGNKWAMERQKWQFQRWFAKVPDFIITLSAPYAAQCSNAQFCALVEHELYHCSFERTKFGSPKFTKDGKPKFAILGHDVEEFVGIVARYGAGNASGATARLVQAAGRAPSVIEAEIEAICSCGATI